MEENDFNFAEYARPVAAKGENKRRRIFLISGYILFAILYCACFTALIMLPQLIAILPLLLWILIHFTWGIVSYECAVRISSGTMSFLRLRGKKEQLLFSFKIKDAEVIAPFGGDYLEAHRKAKASVILHHTSDKQSSKLYYAMLLHEGEAKSIVFEANDKIIRALYYYNKSTVRDAGYINM